MSFNEIKDAIELLVSSFGNWSWSNNDKTLKVKFNWNTYDYNFIMIENDIIHKEIEHTNLERITQCFITWFKGDLIKNYN